MKTFLVRIFATHPLVEACYLELLSAHSELRLVCAFEEVDEALVTVGVFDQEPSHLTAALLLGRRKFPHLRPILLTAGCDDHTKLHWLRSGVCGIVHYEQHKRDLYDAILHVANGRLWFPAALLRHHFRLNEGSGKGKHALLTSREEEVISLLLLMRSNKEIARELKITERTAKFHVTNILRKTEVKSRQTLLDLHTPCSPANT